MTATERVTRAAFLMVLASVGSALAANPIDTAAGEKLAKRWCANCHLVAPDQAKASADAPTFAGLANDPTKTADGLADFLTMPGSTHSKMPDLALSRVEIGDIVGYIATLKK